MTNQPQDQQQYPQAPSGYQTPAPQQSQAPQQGMAHQPYAQQYGQPPHQYNQGYPQQPQYVVAMKQKSHAVAIILSFFLGGLGVDRFYLGHVGLGIAKLLCGWMTLGLWPLIDFILVICKATPGLKRIYWT